ncbi:MAG: ATP-binding protein [Bauldia sp.]|nr:ATP-binding protein [Bauldia sp.]MCW5716888.1 ATP-binding protein [Bauldia sp.]
MTDSNRRPVGMVLGTEASTPLEWWVAIEEDAFLQLDDVVCVRSRVSGEETVQISGLVDTVRASHEGSRFESDVFLADRGVLPLKLARSARVLTTRVEPEVWVPPRPGDLVYRAEGHDRELALHFDRMEEKLAAGFSRDGLPVFLDLSFLDGRRGAHVNISGVSGVATKTSYASFLLFSLFGSGILGHEAANTKAIIFNVKGEDLLFLDRANNRLTEEDRERYRRLGVAPGAFQSVGIWAPVKRGGGVPVPDTGSRQEGVRSYFWTVRDVVKDGLLRFLFAESGDERSQVADLVARVEAIVAREAIYDDDQPATVVFRDGGGPGRHIRSFEALCDYIGEKLSEEGSDWARYAAAGTIAAFLRRLDSARFHCGHLIRGSDAADAPAHRIDWESKQVSVVDIHNLNDRAKRFVVGVVVKRLFEQKEQTGSARPLVFLVLDELNKYAPREGASPIKEVLLDIAERGRSLGVILIGAEQTASEVERRVVANSAIRIVGRLDPAEALRPEYGFLTATARQRASILRPGSMILQQPHLPVALEVSFPFPSWATRHSEALEPVEAKDPFDRFDR